VERFLPARLGAFAAQLRASRAALAGDTATVSFDGTSPRRAPRARAATPVDQAIAAAQTHLFSIQAEDGSWCGVLEGDSILESEYALLMHAIGRADTPRVKKAAEHLRRTQLEDGGWTHYEGGPIEVGGSVKAYFVLKLAATTPSRSRWCGRGARSSRTAGSTPAIRSPRSFSRCSASIRGRSAPP
jgi:squalene-hopene/tetraprenyl-beta-curcumene cyclase